MVEICAVAHAATFTVSAQENGAARTGIENVGHQVRGGATIPFIGSVIGHSYKAIEQILEVYLPGDAEMAKAGIAKLSEYREQNEPKV